MIEQEKSTVYAHYLTALAGYNEAPFILGGFQGNRKSEHWSTSKWREVEEYPFVNQWISSYSAVSVGPELLIFGNWLGKRFGIYNISL